MKRLGKNEWKLGFKMPVKVRNSPRRCKVKRTKVKLPIPPAPPAPFKPHQDSK